MSGRFLIFIAIMSLTLITGGAASGQPTRRAGRPAPPGAKDKTGNVGAANPSVYQKIEFQKMRRSSNSNGGGIRQNARTGARRGNLPQAGTKRQSKWELSELDASTNKFERDPKPYNPKEISVDRIKKSGGNPAGNHLGEPRDVPDSEEDIEQPVEDGLGGAPDPAPSRRPVGNNLSKTGAGTLNAAGNKTRRTNRSGRIPRGRTNSRIIMANTEGDFHLKGKTRRPR